MTKVNKAQPGELLYFYPEELTVLVVMSGEEGFRYIDPMNLEFDSNCNIKSRYVSYSVLSEWTITLGTVSNISEGLMEIKPQ